MAGIAMFNPQERGVGLNVRGYRCSFSYPRVNMTNVGQRKSLSLCRDRCYLSLHFLVSRHRKAGQPLCISLSCYVSLLQMRFKIEYLHLSVYGPLQLFFFPHL